MTSSILSTISSQRRDMRHRDIKAASCLLLFLGMLKLPVAWQAGSALEYDVVFQLPVGKMSAVMALVEIGLAILLLTSFSRRASAICLCATGSAFLSYRVAYSLFAGFEEPCPCLGIAHNLLPFLTFYENRILLALAAWIFLIGLWHLIREREL